MLQARLFDDFKGARTLLLWGDVDGMRALEHGLERIVNGDSEALVGDDQNPLVLGVTGRLDPSYVTANAGLRWTCSIEVFERAKSSIEPLLREHGHQYVDATGDAEQVIISTGEYPADL